MAANANPNQLSPKVKASAYVTLWLSLLGALLATVVTWTTGLTPDQAAFLPVWFIPATTLVTGGLNVLAGFLKPDPLRQNYLTQKAAEETNFEVQVDERFGRNSG